MVKKIEQKEQTVWQCESCGFHYEEKEVAESCEAWCKEHHSCNLEITKGAIENRQ